LNWGWIGHPSQGPGVLIESDGSQHLRATVRDDRILVLVSSFYDGVGGLHEWTANYGRGRAIRDGEAIDLTVRLRLTPARADATPR